MKEFYKGELPLSVTYSNHLYTLDTERTALYAAGKLYSLRGCVLVKIVPVEFKSRRKRLNKKFPAQLFIYYNSEAAKNKAAFRVYLNDKYSEMPPDLALKDFIYLTDITRTQYIQLKTIEKAIKQSRMGDLLHRTDLEGFNVLYEQWLLEPAI